MFHFSLATLLLVQYLIGWHIPGVDDHGMKPSYAMTLHISIGMALITLLALRLSWRLASPAAADSLHATSVGTHWQLYALIFATAVTGWLLASSRGWSNSPFFAVPLLLAGGQKLAKHARNRAVARGIGIGTSRVHCNSCCSSYWSTIHRARHAGPAAGGSLLEKILDR